jgi:hypothetical protein
MAARKKPSVIQGLAAGVEKVDVPALGRGIGEGLTRISEVWLPRGKLAVPQRCPVGGCSDRTYASLIALRTHLASAHAGMSHREHSFVLDKARRSAVQEAMNGQGGAA